MSLNLYEVIGGSRQSLQDLRLAKMIVTGGLFAQMACMNNDPGPFSTMSYVSFTFGSVILVEAGE